MSFLQTQTVIRFDCRHYIGEKPCRFRRLCDGCHEYSPMGARILVIKLAAMGDVIRTTPIVGPIRARHAACHLTWVVDAITAPLLDGIDGIDRVVEMNPANTDILAAQSWDEVYCLDKEPRAIALAARAKSDGKKGFTMTPWGTLGICGPEAEYALRLGLDDPLKFLENTKTYQEIIFEAVGLSFRDEAVRIGVTDAEREAAAAYLAALGSGPYVGVNTGAGPVFATKRLSERQTAELARAIRTETGMTPVVLGGRDETERNARIVAEAGVGFDARTHHTVREFAAIVGNMRALVCADTLAMHLAVAQGVPVVALFGPTCPQEVHLYGKGEKIVSAPWCAPCYKGRCDHHTCMNEIQTAPVIAALRRWID